MCLEIKEVLMKQGILSENDIDNLIEDAEEALYDCLMNNDEEGAENICMDFFGLEPDYLLDLL